MGAPTKEVTALRGKVPLSPGKTHKRLQNKAIATPVKRVKGNSHLLSSELITKRTRCGTASPIKDIGPQKEVTLATSRPVTINKVLRKVCTFIPKLRAYNSPKEKAFKGFIKKNVLIKTGIISSEKSGICSKVTLLKLPIPHNKYDRTPSSVA